jgi:hypothetical protein
MAKRTYGCTSVVNAVCLQFELAGPGLFTSIHRSKSGMWLCEAAIKRPELSSFKRQWLEQAPKGLV